jgi:hypothetical protein
VLAYNLGNLWRRLVLPRRIESWSLTSLQQRLVKTGGRLVRHARYHWFLLRVAENRTCFRIFRIEGSQPPAHTQPPPTNPHSNQPHPDNEHTALEGRTAPAARHRLKSASWYL